MKEERGFASRIGFIFSLAAFCVGPGNIWKFPSVVGANGGGAFLLVYLLIMLLVGFPLFMLEVVLGRSSQRSGIQAMRVLEKKEKTPWSVIGVISGIAIFLIVGYVTMIAGGWSFGYLIHIASGTFAGMDTAALGTFFSDYTGSGLCAGLTVATFVLMWLCLNSGVKKGVEKICSILLPSLLVIMVILAGYTLTLEGSMEGLLWYLIPDFTKITSSTISAALTQVLFSLGIGMCCTFVYGSYISKDIPLGSTLLTTAFLDAAVAVLAGLICVPALFAFNIEPTAGAALLYITLPYLFNVMGPMGTVFGVAFMACVFFACFTSVLGGAEALIATITDSTKMKRKVATTVVVIAECLLSMAFVMSFSDGPLSSFSALGLGFFDFADFIASGIGLTLGAILMLAYVIFKWGFPKFMEEANAGNDGKIRVYPWMKPYFCIVLPIAFLIAAYFVIRLYI